MRSWLSLILILIGSQFVYASEDTSTKQRIISLAPSITETLFAIQADKQLIAVTDYCVYPPAAQTLPSIGNYYHVSLEAIIAQQPDLVILLKEQNKLGQQLEQLNIEVITVDHTSLNGILNSFTTLGNFTGHQQEAKKLVSDIKQNIADITGKLQKSQPVSTLIGIAHSQNQSSLGLVYIAGQHDFYNSLLTLAGGVNVYQDRLLKVPSLTAEGIIQLNPEVIIDLYPKADNASTNIQQMQQHWQQLSSVTAVKTQRVHLLQLDYASIPGPRIFQLIEVFAQLLHPEIDWSTTNH